MKEIRIGKKVITRDFLFFLIASALLGVTMAVESTSLSNRLVEDLNFTIEQRTFLEIPRELPGLLVVFIIGALAALGDVRTAALANILGGIGLFAFGLIPYGFWPVVGTLMIYNMGTHLYMPVQGALSMSFAKEGKIGRRLGEVQSISTVALILTAALLYILYSFVDIPFTASFSIGAVTMVLAGILFLFISPGQTQIRKQRFVLKRKFTLFYVLCIAHGARKQISFVFVPWLLITIYNQPVTTITLLFFIVAVLNVFFRPWIGSFIDSKGERFALILEGALMLLACLGFAFSKLLFPQSVAIIIVSCCYIVDHLSAGIGMARTTYVRRLTNDAAEVSATLALGVSFDHVLAMSMPVFGGILWATNMEVGYVYVFMAGIGIAIVNIVLSNMIRIPKLSLNKGEIL